MIKFIRPLKIKFLTLILFCFCLSFNNIKADTYNEIRILGNQRLSVETIIMFSGLNIDTDIKKEDLNTSIKNLYKTNYFSNIEIKSIDKILEIKVEENPIIQSIKINGVKNKDILEQYTIILKSTRNTLF